MSIHIISYTTNFRRRLCKFHNNCVILQHLAHTPVHSAIFNSIPYMSLSSSVGLLVVVLSCIFVAPPEPEPDVPELILLGRTPQQISNDGGNFSIAIQHLDPNFQVRIHWGDAGDLFTTEEVVLQYGTQSAVNTSLLQTNSEMDFVDTANHMSGNSIELLQIVGSDQGITSFGGEQCDALCGDVPQGVDSTECQCFAFAIPANPQNLTSPDFLDGLPVYISVLNLENFQRVLSPPNFLKYETLFCAGEFWQPDPNSPHCEPCPSCGFCPGGHRVWPLEVRC